MIKGVLLDLDGTLIDFRDVELEVENSLCEELGKKHGIDPRLLFHLLINTRMKHRHASSRPIDNSRRVWFKEIFELLGIKNEDLEELEKRYWKMINSNIKEFPGAREVIKKLREKGLKIGIITDSDGAPEFKDERIRKFGFHELVDFVLKSDEVGYNKPSPIIFEKALEKLGLKPEEVLVVGDDAPRDLSTPKSMGMRTVWINHGGKSIDGNYIDYEIRNIQELIEIIEKLDP